MSALTVTRSDAIASDFCVSANLYCSSFTFSIQSTFLPPIDPWIAICVIELVRDAPCQCF
jgi:hypothetical protein